MLHYTYAAYLAICNTTSVSCSPWLSSFCTHSTCLHSKILYLLFAVEAICFFIYRGLHAALMFHLVFFVHLLLAAVSTTLSGVHAFCLFSVSLPFFLCSMLFLLFISFIHSSLFSIIINLIKLPLILLLFYILIHLNKALLSFLWCFSFSSQIF